MTSPGSSPLIITSPELIQKKKNSFNDFPMSTLLMHLGSHRQVSLQMSPVLASVSRSVMHVLFKTQGVKVVGGKIDFSNFK